VTEPAVATPGGPGAGVVGTTEHRRLDVVDGIRGLAIVLVVLSHGWQLWPVDWIDAHGWVRPFFRSGNTAVTVFLVAAGLLTYRALTANAGLERMRPGVTFVRRLLRVGPSLWAMLAVIMVVATFDSTDETSKDDNLASVLHVVTYTWNWYVQGDLLTSRPDFGHLWYLSVDMQAFVICAALLYMMRRRPVGVLFVLGGFLVLLTWWRFHVSDIEFVFQVLVRTTVRMDAFVVGVLLGAALPLVRRHATYTPRTMNLVGLGALLALVPLFFYCSTDERFLHWGVTLLELDLAVLFGAVSLGARGRGLRGVAAAPLSFLGRHSLLLYIWHYPVFVFVERHTPDLPWQLRTLIALLATAVVCLLSHVLVERRAQALLRHPAWRRLDGGIPAASRAATLSLAREARSRVRPGRS
jgi:peptidoglycan/LPS O-acetylase OafA/YrhL